MTRILTNSTVQAGKDKPPAAIRPYYWWLCQRKQRKAMGCLRAGRTEETPQPSSFQPHWKAQWTSIRWAAETGRGSAHSNSRWMQVWEDCGSVPPGTLETDPPGPPFQDKDPHWGENAVSGITTGQNRDNKMKERTGLGKTGREEP